jgi:hypothetical protein
LGEKMSEIYTKKKLIKDVKEIINAIWRLDPPTENPTMWNILEILGNHLNELKKAKTDGQALDLAKKFKEEHKRMLEDLIRHLSLRTVI